MFLRLFKDFEIFCEGLYEFYNGPLMLNDGIYINESGVILNKFPRPHISDVDAMNIPFGRRNVRWHTEPAPQGDGYQSIFEERIVDGKPRLVVTGKEDLKEFIESSKNETLVDNIIRRYQNGDIYALSRSQGFYGDVSGMPSNLQEARNLLIKLENDFNNLPLEVRKNYDNSFDKYVEAVSSYSVDDFVNNFVPNKEENVNTESEGESNES